MHAYIWRKEDYVVMAWSIMEALAVAEAEGVTLSDDYRVVPEWVYEAFLDECPRIIH